MPSSAAAAWIDGGSRGNPGEAGAGVVLNLGDGWEERHTLYVGQATNNEAEYAALLAALERLLAIGAAEVSVFSDSELLVRQMNGQYKVRAANLRPLWTAARRLARTFRRFSIQHVPRVANSVADGLANQAMDSRHSTLPVPCEFAALAHRFSANQAALAFHEEQPK